MSAEGHQRRLSDVLRMSASPPTPDVSLRCRERSKRATSAHSVILAECADEENSHTQITIPHVLCGCRVSSAA
jgi:hypothetical protein